MAKLNQDVTFHTVKGDRAATVVGHGSDPQNSDNDTELAVFGNSQDDETTGLSHGVNYRWSHEDHQAGGFSV